MNQTPLEFLAQLQSETKTGFHKKLFAWVDDSSEIARTLKAYETGLWPDGKKID